MKKKSGETQGLERRGLGLGPQRDASEFAQRILTRAATLGLNKVQLAAKAAVSRQTLENVLNCTPKDGDKSMPSVRSLLTLAQALKVHPAWVIEGLFSHVAVQAHIDVRMDARNSPNVEHLTHPDGVVVAPGTRFVKTWRIRNDSSVRWPALRLVCQDRRFVVTLRRTGEPLHAAGTLEPDATLMEVPVLEPGAGTDISMPFTAPYTSGTTISRWLAVGHDGQRVEGACFGVWAMVHVTTLADTLAFEPLPL
jgi:transcriptional regulator with XRE-family HTH domain